MNTLANTLEHLLEPPYVLYLAAALVLLLALYLIHYYRRAHRGIVPFKTEGGRVEISPRTLRGILQLAVSGVNGVDRADCTHFVKGQKLGVKVNIHLESNNPLREVEAAIKQRIRSALRDQFGLENVSPIHIRVVRMVGDSIPSNYTSDGSSRNYPTDESTELDSLEDLDPKAKN